MVDFLIRDSKMDLQTNTQNKTKQKLLSRLCLSATIRFSDWKMNILYKIVSFSLSLKMSIAIANQGLY